MKELIKVRAALADQMEEERRLNPPRLTPGAPPGPSNPTSLTPPAADHRGSQYPIRFPALGAFVSA